MITLKNRLGKIYARTINHQIFEVINDSLFYGIVRSLVRMLSVLSIPIYTRFLTQKDFGAYDILLSLSALFSMITDLQYENGVSRYYYEYEKAKDLKNFLSTALWGRLITLIIPYFFILLFINGISYWAKIDFLNTNTLLPLCFGIVVISTINDYFWLILRLSRLKNLFLITSLFITISSLIFSTAFLFSGFGIYGIILGQLISNSATLVWLWKIVNKSISLNLNFQVTKRILIFSLPMSLSPVFGWFSGYFIRILLVQFLSLEQIALYAVAIKVNVAISVVAGAFRMAWQPIANKWITNDAPKSQFVLIARLFMMLLFFIFIICTLCSDLIIKFLAPQSYSEASRFVPYLIFSGMNSALLFVFDIGNQISKKTWWFSISTGIGALINIILVVALISRYGLLLACIANLISSIVVLSIIIISSQKNYHIPHNVPRILVYILGGLSIIAINEYGSFVDNPFLKVTLICFFSLLIFWLMFSASEKRALVKILCSTDNYAK